MSNLGSVSSQLLSKFVSGDVAVLFPAYITNQSAPHLPPHSIAPSDQPPAPYSSLPPTPPHDYQHPSSPSATQPSAIPSAAPVGFVPGKRGRPNFTWNVHLYLLNRSCGDKSHCRCTLYHQGCTGRPVLLNNSIVLNHPVHTDHDDQHVRITVHSSKPLTRWWEHCPWSLLETWTLPGDC